MRRTEKKLVPILILALVAGCSKPTADDHLARGNEYVSKSMIPEAIVEYKLAQQVDPNRGDVRTKLADAYVRNGDRRGALGEYVRAADLLPNDINAQLKAGQFLLMAQRGEDAKARAEKALAIDPANIEALILKGNTLASLKDIDGAISEYQEAISLNPGTATAAFANLGIIQLAQGQRQQAEATFLKAVEAAPKSILARMALANLYWRTGRLEEAEDVLKAALALEPENTSVNRALGVFYLSTGRGTESEPYFQTIVRTAKTTEATIGLSDYYIATNRLDQAKSVLRELAKQPEAFAPATVRLAAIEAAQNNRSVAKSLVDSVLLKQPKFLQGRMLRLRLLMGDQKHDEAFSLANEIIKEEPNTAAAAEAHMAVGFVEASRDRTDEAIKAYSEALRIQPQAIGATLALAQLNMATGKLDKAQTYAQQAVTMQPKNPEARTLLVRVDLARGNSSHAASELATLQAEFPRSAAVLNLVGAQHLLSHRVDAARAAYTAASAAAPGDLESVEGLISIDVQTGRKQDAIRRVEDALKTKSPSAALYTLAGRTYLALGDTANAEAVLRKAIDQEPQKLTAYGLLGQLYISQKRLADAREQYTEIVSRNPRSVGANTMLGMIMEAQQDLKGAEAQYQKTLAMDPDAAVAANNLAWIYVSTNRSLDLALQLAQTAMKHLPDMPQVNDTIGWVYYRKGMYPEAVHHLEVSVQKDPSDPAAHYQLGMAYVQTGEVDKARRSLEKALAMSSGFEGAAEARKTLADLKK